MLNTEIESLKEFIKNKPSSASLTTGSATMEEELYDSKVMVSNAGRGSKSMPAVSRFFLKCVFSCLYCKTRVMKSAFLELDQDPFLCL